MQPKAIVFFFVCFAVGVWTIYTHSINFQGRDPAAIRQHYDFTNLAGNNLDKAVHDQILAGLSLEKSAEGVMIGLGHYAFTNKAGQKTFACAEFKTVSFEFEAEGVVTNGEKPRLRVTGPCQSGKDVSSIDPLLLPLARIRNEKPIDGDIDYSDLKTQISFKNMVDEWPSNWILTKVYFGNLENGVEVDRNEIVRFTGHPIVVEIKK